MNDFIQTFPRHLFFDSQKDEEDTPEKREQRIRRHRARLIRKWGPNPWGEMERRWSYYRGKRRIQVVASKGTRVRRFPSVKRAAMALGICRYSVGMAVSLGKPVKGWTITRVEAA